MTNYRGAQIVADAVIKCDLQILEHVHPCFSMILLGLIGEPAQNANSKADIWSGVAHIYKIANKFHVPPSVYRW